MALNGHVDSYYARRNAHEVLFRRLEGTEKAAVCVVGGGLAGLTTARELANAGTDVVLLEAERVGWGASGRNGGFVSAGYAAGLSDLQAKLGVEATRALYELSRMGVAYVRETIETAGAGDIIGGHGWLKVIRHDDADGMKRRRDLMVGTYGANVEFWETERVRATLKTKTYFQALHDASPFHIDPLAYARLLAARARDAGARIFEESAATALARHGSGWRVETASGVIEAETVVLAGSAYQALSGLWPSLDRAIVPVATYVVTSNALGSAVTDSIGFSGCIADTRRAGDYYRVVEGDRLLWGGRITTRRSEPADLAGLLKADIAAIYPQLSHLEVETAWSGLMAYAVHKMPIIRPLEEGLWSVTAFGGHGVAQTATGGVLVATAITSGDDRWRQFEPFAPRFAGGPVGRMGTQLLYWGMQLRDRREERAAR